MAHVSAPMYWRSVPQRYRLVGKKCRSCGAVHFPPKALCPACGERSAFDEIVLSGRGRVYSFATIASGSAPPEFADQEKASGPYPIAIVELAEGPRITGQLADVDPKDVRIGMPVRAELRRIYEEEGVVRYGFKFVPEAER
jgi:uncharacterized protein